MLIGEVARRAGVNAQTIRFYERRGLIARPRRLDSGYRDYPTETSKRVAGIKRAQKLGFTLAEIQELMQLEEPGLHVKHVRQVALAKLRDIDERIKALKGIRKSLEHLVLQAERGSQYCPVLEDKEDK
jgi:MerR family mercuric resistance operon transcriptional regulator